MGYLSIRDLQKISGEAISALPGATAIKSGDRTVALLVPLKRANMERLSKVLARAEALAKDRDPAEDDVFLAEAGADLTDWSADAVRNYLADIKRDK
jgi:hypothetical protein